MQLNLITPEKTFFSAPADMVVVPGVEGDFGVLPGHAPFISAIRPGVIIIDTADGAQRKIAVMGGFAEVVPERCTVLAEVAIDCSELSATDVEARLDEARAALEAAENDIDRSYAEKKLALAEAIRSAI
jgi:F-type H+-transporting ATPase subunit epsilon